MSREPDRKLSAAPMLASLAVVALVLAICGVAIGRVSRGGDEPAATRTWSEDLAADPDAQSIAETAELLGIDGADGAGMDTVLRQVVGEQLRPVTEDPRNLIIGDELLLRGEGSGEGTEATMRPAEPVTGPTECDGEPGVTISVTVTGVSGTFVASPHWFNLLDTDGGDFPARLDCAQPVAVGAGQSLTMDLVFPDVPAGWLVYGYEYRVTEAIWSVA